MHQSDEGVIEFSFWGSSNTKYSENDCDLLGANKEAEFAETYCFKFSDPSRRREAIEEGRKELMEMMQNTHEDESTYELSFQDMVIQDKHVVLHESYQNETSLDKAHNKAQMKKQKNKNKSSSDNNRPRNILRVESMESEKFLLKMFFPTSLKKVKVEKSYSKVSPKPSSLQESVKQVCKEWRIKRYFKKGDYSGDTEDGMCGNNSSKSRNFGRKFSFPSASCWSLYPSMY